MDERSADGVEGLRVSSRQYEVVRAQIIDSLFSHGSETLVTYIKIWEDLAPTLGQSSSRDAAAAAAQKKPRYIIVTEISPTKYLVHKAKRNTNGSFSIGKTWDLVELKGLKQVSASAFHITLGKSYAWHAERAGDINIFVPALVKAFKDYTRDKPLEVEGFHFENGERARPNKANGVKEDTPRPTPSPALVPDNHSSHLLSPTDEKPPILSTEEPKHYNYEAEEDVILLNVEEMLENFDWRRAAKASGQKNGAAVKELVGSGRGNADLIEARLLGELSALDAASIHSIIESDDRVDSVLNQLDKAIGELDSMYQMLNIYRTELESMGDDISYIESQNRGLQVLTANQKALLVELERVLETITIDQDTLNSIKTGSFQTVENIKQLESAASVLYQALALADDPMLGGLAAVRERTDDYRGYSQQLGKRLCDYLSIYFRYQANELNNDKNRSTNTSQPRLYDHQQIEEYFGRFCGLMLFIKEVEPGIYDQIKSKYILEISDAYRKEVKEFLQLYRAQVRKVSTEELDIMTFTGAGTPMVIRSATLKRSGTVRGGSREPLGDANKMVASRALFDILKQLIPLLEKEQAFMTDFLHISTEPISFCDYLGLDPGTGLGLKMDHRPLDATQLMRDTLDGLFGFLGDELKQWLDWSLKLDPLQVVGSLCVLDQVLSLCDQAGIDYMRRLVESQQRRLLGTLDRLIDEQVKAIEDTVLTAKKRQGVLGYTRVFPNFVDTIESQFRDERDSEVRTNVNEGYNRIFKALLGMLQKMARLESHGGDSGEDKGTINHNIVILENMQYLAEELRARKKTLLQHHIEQVDGIFEQNLGSYVQQMTRRPLMKMIDFVDGADSLLRARSVSELTQESVYNKSGFRRIINAYPIKELRKGIETLSKRVEKHFSLEEGGGGPNAQMDATALTKVVWKSLEAAYQDLYGRFTSLAENCFKGEMQLDFTPNDISDGFRRNQPGSS